MDFKLNKSNLNFKVYTVPTEPTTGEEDGIAIISTSKGIVTDKKAKSLHVGGEVMAFVW